VIKEETYMLINAAFSADRNVINEKAQNILKAHVEY
jgi:hypothetical protein